jgi:esterase/lipase/1-acyl-sn-glycerol-3-phosphate acyltransferase
VQPHLNRFAYRTTGLAIKTIAGLSRARVNIHNEENLPKGPVIFVVNHFTRIETFLLPYQFHLLLGKPVWSLAAAGLFVGKLGSVLEQLGAVSTRSPDRDRLIVKSLLTTEANWIIFPEGRMVKSKKIMERGRFVVSYAGGKHPPHTGAATLALRTEFYRQRIAEMTVHKPEEAQRLAGLFNLNAAAPMSRYPVSILPVNVTYYPIRARDNALSRLAERIVEDLPERIAEEIMTEGSMLLSGVDIDIRFGDPIQIDTCLATRRIQRDICTLASIDFDDDIPARRPMRREALKIMQRYMSAIYRMTTVNHDHLFASCLLKTPTKRLSIGNLRRRAFLASLRSDNAAHVYYHHSFDKDQVHLITDDRYNKFREFLDFALEKKVVTSDDEFIEKQRSRLGQVIDFHRSRIDNPIAVIANEVEPLPQLQRSIARLCWQPGFWLRHKIAKLLMKRAEEEFNRDYEAYADEPTAKPRNVGKPFLIKGDRRRIGIVLAHGYMAAPEEIRGLAEHLGKMGFWVYAPRLKGHGTSPDDLAGCSFHDWIDCMDTGYAVISSFCRKVVAGGFSTGAGLALDLAQRLPDLAGVFAVSTPLRLQDLASRFVPAVDAWNRMMERFHIDDAKKVFVDNQPENPHINYFKNPISGVRELERLMSSLEPRLPEIQAPALLVQSDNDPVVNPKGVEKIFRLLGSAEKQMVMFNFQRHGILQGDGADRVYRTIGSFIESI